MNANILTIAYHTSLTNLRRNPNKENKQRKIARWSSDDAASKQDVIIIKGVADECASMRPGVFSFRE
jgi:hypothetical protein